MRLLTLYVLATYCFTQFWCKEELIILGLSPFTGQYGYVGRGVRPAVDLALEDIRNNGSYLSDYNLTIRWIDTEVRKLHIFQHYFAWGRMAPVSTAELLRWPAIAA